METYKYEISEGDMGSIFSILRDRLYTDKHLAVLREYACNAMDAHRDAGIPNEPIRVDLPTETNLFLRIRDVGRGLSHDDVINVFRKYGKSTKKDSSDAVGHFGIGAKSGHAYSDTFEIVSHHAGTRTVYRSELDASNVGHITRLSTEPTTETGVEIVIPVNKTDIYYFRDRAASLFLHFQPIPIINGSVPEVDKSGRVHESEHGYINSSWARSYQSEVTAVMGGVPYRLDAGRCSLNIPRPLNNRSIVLYFPLKAVDVVPNREELEYTLRTTHAVQEKFKLFGQACVESLIKSVDNSKSGFHRRTLIRQFNASIGFPIHDPKYGAYDKEWVMLLAQGANGMVMADGSPAWMSMIRPVKMTKRVMLDPVNTLSVTDHSTLFISSSPAKTIRWRHFDWRESYRVICPLSPLKTHQEVDQFTSKVHAYLESLDLDGVRIQSLESIRRPPEMINRSEADRDRIRSNLLKYVSGHWEAVDPDEVGEMEFYYPVFRFRTVGSVDRHDITRLHEFARLAGYEVEDQEAYGIKVDSAGQPKEDLEIPSASAYMEQWIQQLRADREVHKRFELLAVLQQVSIFDHLSNKRMVPFFQALPGDHPVRQAYGTARLIWSSNAQLLSSDIELVRFYRQHIANDAEMERQVKEIVDWSAGVLERFPMVTRLMTTAYNYSGGSNTSTAAVLEYADFLSKTHSPPQYDFNCGDQPMVDRVVSTCPGDYATESQWIGQKCFGGDKPK